MTVRQLLRSLDSAELTEWVAYLQIENEKNQQGESTPVVDDAEAWRRSFNAYF